jgi:hypothetical protein
MKNTMRSGTQNGTRSVQKTTLAENQRAEPQNWSQFWPVDSATETRSDALMREVLTGLEREGSIQDRLAGYRSESQGE